MNHADVAEIIDKHASVCRSDLKQKYVPWPWVAILAVSLIGTVAGSAVFDAKEKADLRSDIRMHASSLALQDERISKLEETVRLLADIKSDLTIIRQQTARPGFVGISR